jgi:hypothetical protein
MFNNIRNIILLVSSFYLAHCIRILPIVPIMVNNNDVIHFIGAPDIHNCTVSAGYTFCEITNTCYRFNEYHQLCSVEEEEE